MDAASKPAPPFPTEILHGIDFDCLFKPDVLVNRVPKGRLQGGPRERIMDTIQAVRGFKDILPPETGKWQFIERLAREVFTDFGFMEIRVPILEKTELFRRGIGEATDIVEKEMYTFLDRGDEYLTLRPEATASVLRAYLEHTLYAADPLARLFTIGPMFRRERPQKGRLRQFHQLDAEILGIDDPRVDAELIVMLMHFLVRAGLPDIHLEINSLGCPDCRPAFRDRLIDFLAGKQADLCEDCRRRMNTNPLRIFDCKLETCREQLRSAPKILDFLCPACDTHFRTFREYLSIANITPEINAGMVRGLDYYTRTAFEVTTGALGAQNAVLGGGRYNGLARELGGPDIPGIGFAIGLERLLSLIEPNIAQPGPVPHLFVAFLGDQAGRVAFDLANALRKVGIRTEVDYAGRSLKSQMRRANRLNCPYTLILGDREIAAGEVQWRDMRSSLQETLPLDGLFETVRGKLLEKGQTLV